MKRARCKLNTRVGTFRGARFRLYHIHGQSTCTVLCDQGLMFQRVCRDLQVSLYRSTFCDFQNVCTMFGKVQHKFMFSGDIRCNISTCCPFSILLFPIFNFYTHFFLRIDSLERNFIKCEQKMHILHRSLPPGRRGRPDGVLQLQHCTGRSA